MRLRKLCGLIGLFLCSPWLLVACGGDSAPKAAAYTVGGRLSGLPGGASVVLQLNGAHDITVSVNGTFGFSDELVSGAAYAVTVLSHTPAQTCTVTSASGTVGNSDVTSVQVTCAPVTTVSVIHTFDRDGTLPFSGVIQGRDGNFYGTTSAGGTSDLGTLFNITPAGVETVLYSFDSTVRGSGSEYPPSTLTEGVDGNFYGTTDAGGTNNSGAVFRITPAGVETILHSFGGGTDGQQPTAGLILANDGNFYGTTRLGGAYQAGTVFRITPAGVETVLYSFGSTTTDGQNPAAGLLQASDGNFYGTTQRGGASSYYGTVFRLTAAGVETTLYSFPPNNTTEFTDSSSLIQGSDGNFYGTTMTGSNGVVFKVTPSGVGSTLYAFAGGTDGSFSANSSPTALSEGQDGNFYGTTPLGGAKGDGTVFKVSPAGVETVLYSFAATADGYSPSTLMQGRDGNFYGTSAGGAGDSGTFFKATPAGALATVYSFNTSPEGQKPAGLILGSDGNLYGTTLSGGARNRGTVFKITPAGTETSLYSFTGGAGGNLGDGGSPGDSDFSGGGATVLTQGSDGDLYGTTQNGGESDYGTVFKLTPAGVETVLYAFAGGVDGAHPTSALIQGRDGNFYGTTPSGGTNNGGTIFKITLAGVETVLHSFAAFDPHQADCSAPGADGALPSGALIQGNDGNFYGTTSFGGTYCNGTVFEVTPHGAETVLYSFGGNGSYSFHVSPSTLVQGNDGNLYGTRGGDPLNPEGTVFKITPAGIETVLYAFAGGADGSGPMSALTRGSDGNLYGTTGAGGASGYGTLFRITTAGAETVLYSFTDTDLIEPGAAALTQGADGSLYSVARGGSSEVGLVFKF
jgi:uncharacterized repeat protein (TIGR03803 family)